MSNEVSSTLLAALDGAVERCICNARLGDGHTFECIVQIRSFQMKPANRGADEPVGSMITLDNTEFEKGPQRFSSGIDLLYPEDDL